VNSRSLKDLTGLELVVNIESSTDLEPVGFERVVTDQLQHLCRLAEACAHKRALAESFDSTRV